MIQFFRRLYTKFQLIWIILTNDVFMLFYGDDYINKHGYYTNIAPEFELLALSKLNDLINDGDMISFGSIVTTISSLYPNKIALKNFINSMSTMVEDDELLETLLTHYEEEENFEVCSIITKAKDLLAQQ